MEFAKSTKKHGIRNDDWSFERLGIGGLDAEFALIFRRAFAARLFPPHVIQQLGIKHVKGFIRFLFWFWF